MSKENKATAAQTEERINKVFDLLVSGATRQQILQYVAKKTDWKLADRQVDNYIAKATERITTAGKTRREEELGKAVLRLQQLYFMCLTLQNFQTALNVQREINKLLGLSLEQELINRVEALERHYEFKKS